MLRSRKLCLFLFATVAMLFAVSCVSSFLSRSGQIDSQIEEEFAEKVVIESIEEPVKSKEPVKTTDSTIAATTKAPGAEQVKSNPPKSVDSAQAKKKRNKKKNQKEKDRKNKKTPIKNQAKQVAPGDGGKQTGEKKSGNSQAVSSADDKAQDKSSPVTKLADGDGTTAEGDLQEPSETVELLVHEPADVESPIGFNGRRPIIDPFHVGEKMRFRVTYFGVAAGYLTLETGKFVQVNKRKHYSFTLQLHSSDVFSMFYRVKDRADTYVDYETLLPTMFKLDVKETGQLRDTRAFFDWKALEATMWEKKYTKSAGDQNRKLTWKILPFGQNVFTAAFYMRTFSYEVGKEYAFRVADDGKNILFRGKVLRKERLKTDLGIFNTVVLKADIEIDGVMEPTGDIFFWLTDDDRKFIVKIESKIKIGTVKAYLDVLDRGIEPSP